MLTACRGLSPGDLDAIADLERRVVQVDGGRLKLEWGTLAARDGQQVDDLLWWEGGQLLGFLGLYSFGPSLELAGMVEPAARRRGIATALLDAALGLARDRGQPQALLIVPRAAQAGRALALARGGLLEHSEHALVLVGQPAGGAGDPALALRPAVMADAPHVQALLEAGFGRPATFVAATLAAGPDRTLLIERDGAPVATVRLTRRGTDGGVYGFVVHPHWQGRGIGRDVLRRVCQLLYEQGVRRIGLEVAVDNERALGLYTSVGFTPVTTEDYYALPTR